MDKAYRTIILENENLVREGLRLLLSQTPFSPEDGFDFSDTEDHDDPRPLLFIVVLGRADSTLDRVADLRRRYANARIVVLADDGHREQLPVAVEAGANAALLTSISPDGLVKTLHALMSDDILVVDGSAWPGASTLAQEESDGPIEPAPAWNGASHTSAASLSREPINACADDLPTPDFIPPMQPHGQGRDPRRLSAREYAILSRIVEGDSNKHIARHFDIAEATVKAHVKAILRKIGVANRTQAAIWLVNNMPPGAVPGSDLAGADADAETDLVPAKSGRSSIRNGSMNEFRAAQSS